MDAPAPAQGTNSGHRPCVMTRIGRGRGSVGDRGDARTASADTTLRAVPAVRRRAVSGVSNRGRAGLTRVNGVASPRYGRVCRVIPARSSRTGARGGRGALARGVTSGHAKVTRQRYRKPLFPGGRAAMRPIIVGRGTGTGQTRTALS